MNPKDVRTRIENWILSGTIAASAFGCNLSSEERPMNVVFIMTDQQPTSTLGCYGNPLSPTPNLDRLAQSGARFTNFYIGAHACSPSRAGILTGSYPQRHGVFQNNVKLSDDIPSMGYIMKSSGRDTGYFGKSHLEGATYRDVPGGQTTAEDGQSYYEPFNNGHWYWGRLPGEREIRFEKMKGGKGEDAPQLGFDTWAGGWKDYRSYLNEVGLGELVETHPMVGNHYDIPNTTEDRHQYSLIPEEHHMAAFFTKKALEFLADHRGGSSPFCMVLSYFGPHLPVAPPRPWDEKYALDQIDLPPNHDDHLENKPETLKKNDRCYLLPKWTEEQFKDYIRRYYGYSAYIDHQIGRVLEALAENGLEDNTIVIFTSDHGDMVGAHGSIFKIGTGYEELAKVPFIMRAPGITKPGFVADSLVSNIDIMPTLIDLLELPEQKDMHGKSFKDVLSGASHSFRDRIFSHWGTQSFLTFDGEWKYQLHWKSDMDELYNLRRDPGEMKNLAMDPQYGDIAAENRKAILDWLWETDHPYAEAVSPIR
jgi:arylsulfatase A-like enzyme